MNKIAINLLLTLLMSMMGLQAHAEWSDDSYSYYKDGLYYFLDNTNHEAEVTNIRYSYGPRVEYCVYEGDITIPASIYINGSNYSVTSISSGTFSLCRNLTSITIPNSVTSIDSWAFSYCIALASVTIPNSVKSIGAYAFYGCSGLSSVTITNGVIGNNAFDLCGNITSVTLGNGVTSIGNKAFYGNNFSSITIPNSVTYIGTEAFCACGFLTSITIGNGVKWIGDRAFHETPWWKWQPLGLVYVGKYVYSCNGKWFSDTNITLEEGTLGIACSAFYGTNLTSITIPNTVRFIGNSAFENCTALTSVNIGNGVREIVRKVFSGCSGLTSVTIGNSVTYIDDDAFEECSGLTTVTVKMATPIRITSKVFKNCANATLNVPQGCLAAYKAAYYWKEFKEIREIIPFADLNVKALCVANWDKDDDGELSMKEASEVTDLGTVFKENNTITSFDELCYFTSLTSIGESAFYNCSSLTSIEVPSSMTSIDGYAFYGCSGLTSILIPNNVTSIGENAFNGCSGLTSIEIPNNVTSIGDCAFSGCNNLTTVTVKMETPIKITSEVFTNRANARLYVPQGCLGAYKAANYWKEFKEILKNHDIVFADSNVEALCVANWDKNRDGELSAKEASEVTDLGTVFKGKTTITSFDELSYFTSLTSIGSSAFSGCSGLTSVTIPNGVTSIEYGAFYGCSGLNSIEIPNSVTSIGSDAFTGCISLTSIDISNITYLGEWAFENCTSLTSVTIGNGVTWIRGVFNGCTSLTSVTIGNGMTNIEEYAFSGCSALTSITIPNSVTNIGGNVFQDCSALTSVTIGNSVKSIGGSAFNGCSGLTSITIGNSVTSIANDAFSGCNNLTTVRVKMATPIKITSEVFTNRANARLYVPQGCYYAYQAANYWKEFKLILENRNIVFADSNVEAICIANWDKNRDGELSAKEASEVTDLGSVFNGNATITSFDEMRYFTCLTSIGCEAFYNCSSLTSIKIPNSVTSIGTRAFEECSGLTSIEIPNSVSLLDEYAFYGCTSLASVTIGNGMTNIKEYAFKGCSALTSITIPNSVTNIGGNVFQDCSALTSVTIGNNVTSIGYSAFEGCSGLTSIIIPNSVTSIEDCAFSRCDNLTTVSVKMEIPINITSEVFTNRANARLYVPQGCLDAYKAANYWKEFKEIWGSHGIVFTDSNVKAICIANWDIDRDGELSEKEASEVTDLGTVFKGNTTITSFNELCYFTSLTSIGTRAFEGCSGLTSIEIPNSVTSIDDYAFYNCSALSSVIISNSVTSIGSKVFHNCIGLQKIIVKDLAAWCRVSIADVIENAHHFYLDDNTEITDLVIPDGVTNIGNNVFSGCSSLSSVIISNSVTNIGSGAFFNCSGLTSAIIGNNVTNIEGYSFYGCSGLTSIELPSSVKSIDGYAFNGCSSLVSVKIYAKTPPSARYTPFPTNQAITLYVPRGSKAAYEAANVWKDFSSIVEFDDIIKGDINGDGKVDVSDYIGIANHIMGSTPEGFVVKAADVNEDGIVDVSDYIGVANIILTGSIYGNANNARMFLYEEDVEQEIDPE